MPRCCLHPVGRGVAAGLARFTEPAISNGAGEQQQFFHQRGLTTVRGGNDGEGAAAPVSGAARTQGSKWVGRRDRRRAAGSEGAQPCGAQWRGALVGDFTQWAWG